MSKQLETPFGQNSSVMSHKRQTKAFSESSQSGGIKDESFEGEKDGLKSAGSEEREEKGDKNEKDSDGSPNKNSGWYQLVYLFITA